MIYNCGYCVTDSNLLRGVDRAVAAHARCVPVCQLAALVRGQVEVGGGEVGGEVAAAAVGLARLRGTVLTSLHGYIMEVTWSQCRLCTVSPCPHRQQLRHCLWNTRPRVLTTSAWNTCTRGWVRRPSAVQWRHLAPAPRTRLLLGLRPDGGGAGAGLGLVPADLGVAGPAVHLLVVHVDLELQSGNNHYQQRI